MNVLLIGSGGREHALAAAISKSDALTKLYAAPGNPGILNFSEQAGIDLKNYSQIIEFCKNKNIDLVVVGPEQPLAEGLADILRTENIKVFGPSKNAAMLESSKGFAKDFMLKYGIPTAKFRTFEYSNENEAIDFINKSEFPLVLKADGLAAGKGVVIAQNSDEAIRTIRDMFGGAFNEAGKCVVIEEFMNGQEASILAITDGNDFITLAASQDHKRVFDSDLGPNTGGMGAYAPTPVVTDDILEKMNSKIIEPVIKYMAAEGNSFIGCLYVGLMIKDDEPKVVEFNVRFGDPETQAVLPLFDGDFLKLLYSASIGELDKSVVKNVNNGFACNVVLASEGYPGIYKKDYEITGIENAESMDLLVYHAGTTIKEGKLVTSGGRVLGVCGISQDLQGAIDKAYKAIKKIHFNNMFFRKDIGFKGLK